MSKLRKRKSIPGCRPGSIEQQLDMCERGPLRGDQILHDHGATEGVDEVPESRQRIDQIAEDQYFEVDMQEEDREGDELTGDEHSSGLQGDETELDSQPHIRAGVPGEEDKKAS